MPYLVVQSGDDERLESLTDGVFRIGRDADMDLVLVDTHRDRPMISRKHAQLTLEGSSVVLTDLNSRNGTRVNDRLLPHGQPVPLQNGDVLRIGSSRLLFLTDRPESPPDQVVQELDTQFFEAPPDWKPAMAPKGVPRPSPLDLLLPLTSVIGELADAEKLVRQAVFWIFSSLGPERVFLGLLEDGIEGWKREESWIDGGRTEQAFRLSQRLIDQALHSRKAVILSSLDPRLGEKRSPSIQQEGIRAGMCCPILSAGRSSGVIYLDDRQRVAFQEHDLRLLAGLATVLGALIAAADKQDLQTRSARARSTPLNAPVVGRSEAMVALETRLAEQAETHFNVLLTGPTGSGKSTLARDLHLRSLRAEGPFIKVSCARIPESLFESEMLGYGPHSGISGADPRGKPGFLELADKGTLFLDEVGDLPVSQQAKLLDVLEDGEFYRLGETRRRKVSVRVVSATSLNLDTLMRTGRFRSELYYRLARITLQVPSLSERIVDLTEIVSVLQRRLAVDMPRKQIRGISPEALDVLSLYPWPGNIRELENYLAAAMAACPDGGLLLPEHFLPSVRFPVLRTDVVEVQMQADGSDLSVMDRLKRTTLAHAILKHGTLAKASESLGWTRGWGIELAKRLGIRVVPLKIRAAGEDRDGSDLP